MVGEMANRLISRGRRIDRRTVLRASGALAAVRSALVHGAVPKHNSHRKVPPTRGSSILRFMPMQQTRRSGPGTACQTRPPHLTGDEMVAAMDKVGVDGAIYISPFSMYQYDGSYAVSVPGGSPRPVCPS